MTREEEIVRRVRATFDAFNRCDFDAAIAFMHPDVELVRAGVEQPLRGVEQVRSWMEPNAFESQVIQPVDITVSGSKVLVFTNTKARGASSGIEVEIDAWNVFTVDDDLRLTRAETYFLQEEEEARRAAAVADPGPSG